MNFFLVVSTLALFFVWLRLTVVYPIQATRRTTTVLFTTTTLCLIFLWQWQAY